MCNSAAVFGKRVVLPTKEKPCLFIQKIGHIGVRIIERWPYLMGRLGTKRAHLAWDRKDVTIYVKSGGSTHASQIAPCMMCNYYHAVSPSRSKHVCMHPFAMEMAAILVHSLNRFFYCAPNGRHGGCQAVAML